MVFLKPAAIRAFRRRLLTWFGSVKRDLAWRRTRDPYRIWLSEIMLQQTRVAAAEPYYERFVARFPDVASLAGAPEQDVLAHWAGLGYYSRARNLHKAAKSVEGDFPSSYAGIRALPGVGDYTAAAVASIAFGLPHAVLDGNVARVTARLAVETGDIGAKPTRDRLSAVAHELLDPAAPGDFNQAMMELGATVCLPRNPMCLVCPVTEWCRARLAGRQTELPLMLKKQKQLAIHETLLIIEKDESLLVWQRPPDSPRMAGFWELPEQRQLPRARLGPEVGVVRHTITFHNYTFRVHRAFIKKAPSGFEWFSRARLAELPASTILRKAIALAFNN